MNSVLQRTKKKIFIAIGSFDVEQIKSIPAQFCPFPPQNASYKKHCLSVVFPTSDYELTLD